MFLRDKLPKAFPGDHVRRLKALFSKEWEKISSNAVESRRIGGTSTAIRDEYDLLGTNHFFAIFNQFYDRLIGQSGNDGNAPPPVKIKRLPAESR
jgi:hypothetical protein